MFVDNIVYQYLSMFLATTFLVPQIYSSYYNSSAKDISSVSIIFIIFSSTLWGLYMYEKNLLVYTFCSFFLTINALILSMIKVYTFAGRVREHYNSFEQPPSTAIPVQVQTQI